MSRTKRKGVFTKPTASIWIKADGTQEEVYPAGNAWTLDEMQAKVGGYIEVIPAPFVGRDKIVLANEEGLLRKLPHNPNATLLVGRSLVGDVLIVPRGQFK